jgi:hypothetical protein
MPPKNQTQRIDELLGGVTEELLLGNPQQFEDNSIRVGYCQNSSISLSTAIASRRHRH